MTEQTDVEEYLRTFEHPNKEVLLRVREIILGVDPKIQEGIKWKVPSFRTTEFFATFHVRSKKAMGLVLHFGAKKRQDLPERSTISDPTNLLEWLSDDRAMITFGSIQEVDKSEHEFANIIRQWSKLV